MTTQPPPDTIEAALAAHLDRTPAMAEQIRAVFAAETPCPGGHRNDGGYGDYGDLWADVMTENEIPDEIESDTDLAAQNPQRHAALGKVVLSRWIVAGACKLTIPVYDEWDGDGEYRSWSYPVAEGPCAETMQLNEDYEDAFWASYFTQERLRKAVEKILCAEAWRAALEPVEPAPEARPSGAAGEDSRP
jgi:hypothetical protein